MMTDSDFRTLIDACRQGEAAAMATLIERFSPPVRVAVRRRLPPGLRQRFDSQDFAQDVWLSFFRVALDRATFPTEAALVGFLAAMARLKVAEEDRHQRSLKVALGRNTPLDQAREPAGREPSPSALAAVGERWDHLLAGLPERDRRMLKMLRDGHTYAEVAAAVGLSEKTVQRLVRRVQPSNATLASGQ